MTDKMNERYRDIRLFIWLIPAINVINYYLTYKQVHPLWRLFVTFSIDTALGYLAWLLVRGVINWLDKKMPLEDNPSRRIAIQLLLTIVAGLGVIVLVTVII